MKYIQKGPEPRELAEWKRDWLVPATKWRDLPGDVASALRDALFNEQGHICCYCGRRLVPNDSHIEHLVPRNGPHGNAALTFEHTNLLACCQANLLKRDPIHCGMAKDDWYDAVLLVSPLRPDCETRFHFELDGRIVAASAIDDGAAETIRRLALDCPRLSGLRSKTIEALFEGLDSPLTEDECERLAEAHRRRDAGGMFEPFCFVVVAALRFFTTPLALAPAAP